MNQVLLLDNRAVVHAGLRLLAYRAQVEVAGSISPTFEDGLVEALHHSGSVILLDAGLPISSSDSTPINLPYACRLLRQLPTRPVVVVLWRDRINAQLAALLVRNHLIQGGMGWPDLTPRSLAQLSCLGERERYFRREDALVRVRDLAGAVEFIHLSRLNKTILMQLDKAHNMPDLALRLDFSVPKTYRCVQLLKRHVGVLTRRDLITWARATGILYRGEIQVDYAPRAQEKLVEKI